MAMPVLLIGAFAARLVSAQDTPTVGVRDAVALGPILVDARGFTLYVFDRDTPGTSACVDACAQTWPPLLIEGGDPTGPADLVGTLGVPGRDPSGDLERPPAVLLRARRRAGRGAR